jgi:PPOX class probable F420-dependent enzyme
MPVDNSVQVGSMTADIPAHLVHLRTEPNFGSLATVRQDTTAPVNPMWLEYDGARLPFTHTSKRAKFRNLQKNPSMALAVVDPENPQSHIAVRGELAAVRDDPTGDFSVRLGKRYGKRYGKATQVAPPDTADRVIRVMRIARCMGAEAGHPQPRMTADAPQHYAVCRSCSPSAISSTSFALNAGRSSGVRLETRPLSTTTSSSTQFAPALTRSVLRLG